MRCWTTPVAVRRCSPGSPRPLRRGLRWSASPRSAAHELPNVVAYADLYAPLDHASRNLRVLARRCVVSLWRHETVPEAYLDLMDQLAEVVRFMAIELKARRLPTGARKRLVAVGDASSHVELVESISAVVILAQLRSMTSDLLELTGITTPRLAS